MEELENKGHQMGLEEVQTFQNKSSKNLRKTSKKKNWIPIAIGAIIAIFFLTLVFCFFIFYPKYVLMKSFNMWTNSFHIMEKSLPSSNQYDWDEMTTKGTATMEFADFFLSDLGDTETTTIFQKLNDLSFQVETRVSKKNHKSFIDINGRIENEKFFDLSYIQYDQKQYILLKEVLETYLQLEDHGEIIATQIDTETFYEEIEYVWGVLKKSLKKNMKSSYIKKRSENIIIDEKKIRTTKWSLVIDEKANYELYKNMIKDLKADQKAYDILVNLYPQFADYEERTSKFHQICYSVYVTKGIPRIVASSLSVDENESLSLIKSDDYVFEFEKNREPLFRIIIKEEPDDFKMKVQLLENNLEIILMGKKEERSTIYNFSIKADGNALEIVSTHILKEEKSDLIAENIQLSFQVKTGGLSLDIMNINLDFETTKGAMFEEIKNSKLITDLTEEEQQKIQSYFENIFDM